ncbi:bifunctional 2-polyprenyl-6-hydroxyphenol methylase/3-demethylubiquinol 3-O-methyltransferase UbiG [Afifella sp. IM 167]|uniref:bifunctional 2-polyprenyl-6-hydroxyphenol methylase/3-demethylubiquinol 3-O-methyltransferase UbiG n=1 Tax=Afifella sp. IM 167 TaxID=2033586 RepID=UPI001CCE83BB|nr:bifunctional 2-polyprenyl-6-hydroxyphenol methylase/3-demethylubiquinol 3-O-methyltransferase UbiG [Afifella sp. IM 167]MBZ8133029.1 bifunctional 3-demethylubiquinol 3-O-methyltransferase/2-polyprenyl-6-hydroxyphenol methylase [Afifella sp. IM 167]
MSRAQTSAPQPHSSIDPQEVAKFEQSASDWWGGEKNSPLHKLNPVRLDYIGRHIAAHFGRPRGGKEPFKGLTFVDVGCGGGLLAEPMARLGGTVTGVDPSANNVEVAKAHAAEAGLVIDYRHASAEDLAAEKASFDVVLSMEVIEHVSDVEGYVAAAAALVKPGGLIFFATLNRTLKSFALAIVGVEYVLRWLPRGTHSHSRFIRPSELAEQLVAAGLTIKDETGVTYNPLFDRMQLSRDMDVNYMMLAEKKAAA